MIVWARAKLANNHKSLEIYFITLYFAFISKVDSLSFLIDKTEFACNS